MPLLAVTALATGSSRPDHPHARDLPSLFGEILLMVFLSIVPRCCGQDGHTLLAELLSDAACNLVLLLVLRPHRILILHVPAVWIRLLQYNAHKLLVGQLAWIVLDLQRFSMPVATADRIVSWRRRSTASVSHGRVHDPRQLIKLRLGSPESSEPEDGRLGLAARCSIIPSVLSIGMYFVHIQIVAQDPPLAHTVGAGVKR